MLQFVQNKMIVVYIERFALKENIYLFLENIKQQFYLTNPIDLILIIIC